LRGGTKNAGARQSLGAACELSDAKARTLSLQYIGKKIPLGLFPE